MPSSLPLLLQTRDPPPRHPRRNTHGQAASTLTSALVLKCAFTVVVTDAAPPPLPQTRRPCFMGTNEFRFQSVRSPLVSTNTGFTHNWIVLRLPCRNAVRHALVWMVWMTIVKQNNSSIYPVSTLSTKIWNGTVILQASWPFWLPVVFFVNKCCIVSLQIFEHFKDVVHIYWVVTRDTMLRLLAVVLATLVSVTTASSDGWVFVVCLLNVYFLCVTVSDQQKISLKRLSVFPIATSMERGEGHSELRVIRPCPHWTPREKRSKFGHDILL